MAADMKVDAKAIPLDVVPEGSAAPWRIFGPSGQGEEPQAQSAFDSQKVPLTESGSFSPFQVSTPEAIIRAVGDVLQLTSKPTHGDGILFRRLRTFSGVVPTPQGEEQLENWVEQSKLMKEEYDRPEEEKKMRIMESVKGPALEILQAVHFNDPSATSMDYIDILETTFGNPESGEELYFAFRMLCQQPNEKLSEFLRRMERILNKVVKKGGIQSSAADKARLDQLIKGAIRSDLMILNLGLRDRRDNPPTFLELMNGIRLEEEHEAARRRLLPPKAIYAKSAAVTADTELNDLKAEIHQLRAQVSELFTPAARSGHFSTSTLLSVTLPAENAEDRNVQALKKEVVKLRKQVSVISVKPKYSPATEPSPQETQLRPRQQRPSTARDPSDFFCYRCGEEGHFANKCASPKNYPKVIQKLLEAQRKSKQNRRSDNERMTQTTNASVKRRMANAQGSSLPEGLVGPPSTAQLRINGNPCTALMDSGSQVTIIFDCWYAKHLSHFQLNSVTGLAIWGLSESESSYPYKGYIQVELELPQKSKSRNGKSVPILALVCPDPRCSETIPVLIGTNVRGVQPFKCRAKKGDLRNVNSVKIQAQERKHSLAHAGINVKCNKDLPVAEVRWSGPGPLSIPPGTEYVAICKVKEKQDIGGSILIIERAHSPALPPSVLVQPTVLFSKMLDPNNFLVLLRNESLKQTAIPMGTVIAHLHVVDMVTDASNPKVESVPAMDPSLFNFSDSPISKEWKERLSQKLAKHTHVFSVEE